MSESLFENLLKKRNEALKDRTSHTHYFVANIRSSLENIGASIVQARVKSPTSIGAKINKEPDRYQQKNDLKDFIGFMAIFNDKQTAIEALKQLEFNYGHLKNPQSSKPVDNTSLKNNLDKPYETTDGYKNCKIRYSINEFPTEIQLKTREQYVAHFATHPVYKIKKLECKEEYLNNDKSLSEEDKLSKLKRLISDKMYPYFEAQAYLHFNKDNLTQEEILKVKEDINQIFQANRGIYKNYPSVFENAQLLWATYCFIADNHEQLYANSTFRDSTVESALIEAKIGRVFRYSLSQIKAANPTLTNPEIYQRALIELSEMPYEVYQQKEQASVGMFKKGTCSVETRFDIIREKDVDLLKTLSNEFNEIAVKIYDDEYTKMMGTTVFDQNFRAMRASLCKNVDRVSIISPDGTETPFSNPTPILREPEEEPKYDVIYKPGAFQGLHPGHIKHIYDPNTAKETYLGVKTDNYIRDRKHKEPVVSQEDRLASVDNLAGVTKAYLTEDDIFPPPEVLERMKEVSEQGGKVAIEIGSDWINHPEKKSARSLDELKTIQEEYPFIELAQCLDRVESKTLVANGIEFNTEGISSTGIGAKLVESRECLSHTNLVVSYENN